MEAASLLYVSIHEFPGWCSLILDYAKIIHEY